MISVCRRELPFPSLGIVVVLGFVAMLFAAFTAALLIRRTATDWVSVPMPSALLWSTCFLFGSVWTLEVARRSGVRQQRWLGVTLLLGLGFLASQIVAGMQMIQGGFALSTHPHASFFYVLAGLHGAHIVGGILALLLAGRRAHWRSACIAYWHAMAGVWVWILALLWVI